MSTGAVSWAVRESRGRGLGAEDRLVLALLGDQAADDGWAVVGVDELAGLAETGVPQVRECLGRLADAGLLCVGGEDGFGLEVRLVVDGPVLSREDRAAAEHFERELGASVGEAAVVPDELTLDEAMMWLEDVTGVGEGYVDRWPLEAWGQWAVAWAAWRDEERRALGWLRELVMPWENEFSVPFPCVARVPAWSAASRHDWFAEAAARPGLWLSTTFFGVAGEPDLGALEQAWSYASSAGLCPAVSMSLVPAAPWGQAVVGAVEGFAVLGAGRADDEVLTGLLGTGRRRTRPVEDWGEQEVLAWELVAG